MTAKEFNTKVVPLSDKLFRYAYRFLSDADQSKDAVQDVFVKLWNQRDKLANIESIEAFAVRVTRNQCLDMIKTRHTVSMDVNDYFKDRISDESNPEMELYKSDSMKKLISIINKLSEPHRTVIQMRDVEGYSNEEVGDVLGLSEGNIRVVLSRARKKVRESLEKLYVHGTEENRSIIAEIL
ncbi:MAG: RNA polymerase sigma factor [Bacteroidetes bacterium]|jgi:RNA polymerase sigma factor (sigma-70 family)|nr:RNA polymerase sigma factor [Bacteroidota bacterium]MBT3750351.1 RNA polymerase sigma factor [Bacteroidota bacterium]MBT4401634.1 RNA polymerase sigma factor [Bacteroidota bacterium]MBT4410152.1 RNA polymerase sigma factor [Bacteroidota bacterium]MBT5427646.1 RNA polymerase sigma factor [Bacteroidota bacterium]